jgi:hypothetical protein
MIYTKLTVPFIRDKILAQAIKCKFATAIISEAGLKFVTDRVSPHCNIEIITGLDLPTPPSLLEDILERHENITLKVFTKDFFHPKVFLFYLSNGSRRCFIGSGNFTMGGMQRNEELFYEVIQANELEDIESWFDNCLKISKILTQELIEIYKVVFFAINESYNKNANEIKSFKSSISDEFEWRKINFTDQYFTESDYRTFDLDKSSLTTIEIVQQRMIVQRKILDLHFELKNRYINTWPIHEHYDSNHVSSSIDPNFQPENRVRAIWVGYGRSRSELMKYSYDARHLDFIRLQFIIRNREFGIWLMLAKKEGSLEDRSYFRQQMNNSDYRMRFFNLFKGLGDLFWINVAGVTKFETEFSTPDDLWKFTQKDHFHEYFTIGRNFVPGDGDIKSHNIVETIYGNLKKMLPLYSLMKDKSFG